MNKQQVRWFRRHHWQGLVRVRILQKKQVSGQWEPEQKNEHPQKKGEPLQVLP